MKPTSLALLAVFLLSVEAQDPASRTYGSHYYHSHAGHNHGVHTHGHHNHGVPHHPVHQHGHPPHPHPSVHHQGPTHTGHGSHQHHARPPTSDTLQSLLQAQGHPNRPHQQHSSVPVQAATSVKTVPVMVCRIIQLPVGPVVKPVPTFVPKEESPSRPQQVFRNITASIGNVVGRVIHPVVSLLNSPSGWFNRTTPGNHGHSTHHHSPHNFTVLNHTAHHGQSHNARPHHNRRNFTAPNVGDVRNQLAGHVDVNRHPLCPFPVLTSPPAVVTEATTTSSPTPAITTAAYPTTTVRVPILNSSLCGQGPAPHVPALRAYPFTVQDAAAISTNGPIDIPKEPIAELYQEITTTGNTVLPTTLANVRVSLPEDRTQGTVPTSAAATLLAESNTQYTPVPVGNDTAATTYSPASDTVSSQSPAPSTTPVVPTTVRSLTSLNATQMVLPATRNAPNTPSAVESTSVVPEDAPDAASSGTVSFTTTSHRFV